MAHRPSHSALAFALTGSRWAALLGGAGAVVAVVGMLVVSSRTRDQEFPLANAMTARAVAGYLSVVAPVDLAGSEYALVTLLSAVHTLRASPRWHRGLQVAWGNAPLLPDSLGLTPLESATRRALTDSGGPILLRRSGRSVALVSLLDREQRTSIGWVAIWGSLAPERGKTLVVTLIVAMAVSAGLAILLPAPLLPGRTRWGLVLLAGASAVAFAQGERHRADGLAARRDSMVLGRVRHLIERAVTMPRIQEGQLVRIVPGWQTDILEEADSRGTGLASFALRSGSVLVIRSPAVVTRWNRLDKMLAAGVGGFVLAVCLGAWGMGRRPAPEKAESTENSTPLSD